MKDNFSYKTFFINYGIFLGIITVTFLILIYSVTLSRKSWQRNLKPTIEKVLEEKEPNVWSIENYQILNNPFTVSAACYDVRNRKNGEMYKAVILRVTTFYGPLPAVFIVDSEDNVRFIGYSNVHGRVQLQLETKKSNKRIDYWVKKLPDIIRQE